MTDRPYADAIHFMVPITSSISTPAVVLRRNALRQVPNTEGWVYM